MPATPLLYRRRVRSRLRAKRPGAISPHADDRTATHGQCLFHRRVCRASARRLPRPHTSQAPSISPIARRHTTARSRNIIERLGRPGARRSQRASLSFAPGSTARPSGSVDWRSPICVSWIEWRSRWSPLNVLPHRLRLPRRRTVPARPKPPGRQRTGRRQRPKSRGWIPPRSPSSWTVSASTSRTAC